MTSKQGNEKRGQFSSVPTSSKHDGKNITWGSGSKCGLICSVATLVIGSFLVLAGIAGFYALPDYFEAQVKQKAILKPGTTTWESWQNPPINVYYNYTIFNVENPEEAANGAKPILKEQGPYVYREIKRRDMLDPETEEGTIVFRQNITLVFDAEKSAPLTESDVVTVISPVTAGVGAKMAIQKKTLNYWVWSTIEENILDFDDGLFITKTVKELMAEGYESAALKATQEFAGTDKVPSTRFPGLQAKQSFGKNESYEGVYEIFSGAMGTEYIGQIVSYNGERELDYWPDTDNSNSCNQIKGTDGALFGPLTIKPDKDVRLYVFIADLCRSLFLKYETDVIHHEIKTHRYSLPYEAVADPKTTPEFHCLCPEQYDIDECSLGAAVMPRNRCQPGSPVIMSTPHFYLTNFEEYYTNFEGLMPQKELHETYLDLDPVVSIPLSARKRIQVNMDVRKNYPLPSFHNIEKDLIFPLMWVEQGADFDATTADKLKSKVYKTRDMLDLAPWAFIGLGAVFLFGSLIYLVIRRRS